MTLGNRIPCQWACSAGWPRGPAGLFSESIDDDDSIGNFAGPRTPGPSRHWHRDDTELGVKLGLGGPALIIAATRHCQFRVRWAPRG